MDASNAPATSSSVRACPEPSTCASTSSRPSRPAARGRSSASAASHAPILRSGQGIFGPATGAVKVMASSPRAGARMAREQAAPPP